MGVWGVVKSGVISGPFAGSQSFKPGDLLDNAPMTWLDDVKWDDKGLIPVIAQEQSSGDVLMFAWMNREALAATAQAG